MFDVKVYINYYFDFKNAANLLAPVAEQCGIDFEKTRDPADKLMYFGDLGDGTCLVAAKVGEKGVVLENKGVGNTELYFESGQDDRVIGQVVCYGDETGEAIFVKKGKDEKVVVQKYNYDSMCMVQKITGTPVSTKTLFFRLKNIGVLPDETLELETIEEAMKLVLETQSKYKTPQNKK